MRRWVLLFALIGGMQFPLGAATEAEEVRTSLPREEGVTDEEGQRLNDTIFGRAVAWEQMLSSTFSSTTGLAISPLLGMSVLGGWQYLRADAEGREELPWYTHPAVWGICLGIFLLGNLKDTAGVMVPEALKKPLSVLEVLENQLSAAVVALAVLPASVAAQLPEMLPPEAGAGGGGAGVWAVAPVAAFPLLMIPVMIVIFATVCTVSHAVKCLLLLSPSSFITAGVKLAKGVFLALFAGIAYFLPWVGIVVSILILLLCIRLFGWAFRWNVYGSLFAWDFFGSRFDRELEDDEPLQGFLLRGSEEVPSRTYGALRRDGDELVFEYRPWMIFGGRKIQLPVRVEELGLRKGLLFPSVTQRDGEGDSYATLMEMRLRFRSHEDGVAQRLGVTERQPSRVIQGARNAIAWLWEQVRMDLDGPSASKGNVLPA